MDDFVNDIPKLSQGNLTRNSSASTQICDVHGRIPGGVAASLGAMHGWVAHQSSNEKSNEDDDV